jgi:hypothetical protein
VQKEKGPVLAIDARYRHTSVTVSDDIYTMPEETDSACEWLS